MIVTAWKGGSYGIRVGRRNVRKHFPPNWKSIEVRIDGQPHIFKLTSTFWTTCPEFRGAVVEKFLKKNGLIPWRPGKPPKLRLLSSGGSRFRIILDN